MNSNNATPVIYNGVTIPARLRVNEMTLSEWVQRAGWDDKFNRVSREELRDMAKRMGFSEVDIAKEIP